MPTEISLGKLVKCDDLRSVWKNEAYDFTIWLAEEENLNLLGETLGVEIELINTEEPAGAFSIDILAKEVATNRKIIIENQLEKTNHDHLGKIITYASAKQAEIIVWVVKEARDEHRQAIEWLNEKTDEEIEFYLLEIELWRIGNSDIAPKFSIISAPNGWMKANKSVEKGSDPNNSLKLEYWEKFCEYSDANYQFIKSNRLKYGSRNWLDVKAGTKLCSICLAISIQKKRIRAAIYCSKKTGFIDIYKSNEDEINSGFDEKLYITQGKKDATINIVESADITDRSDWERQFKWLCDTCMKLKEEIVDKYKSQ